MKGGEREKSYSFTVDKVNCLYIILPPIQATERLGCGGIDPPPWKQFHDQGLGRNISTGYAPAAPRTGKCAGFSLLFLNGLFLYENGTDVVSYSLRCVRTRLVLTVSKLVNSLRTAGHSSLVNIAPLFESRRKQRSLLASAAHMKKLPKEGELFHVRGGRDSNPQPPA